VCDYRELPPPRPHATSVACLWTRSRDRPAADPRPRILPDGCVDLVWIGDAAPAVVGPATRADLPTLPPRSTIVGVRFRPGMAAGLLGVPARELLDRQVPLRDLWGSRAARPWADLGELPSVEARLAALEAVLLDRLAAAGPADHLVGAAAAWLARHPAPPVGRLSHLSGLSERQLLRRFETAVGYGPKTLQRILRFQRWLRLARRRPAARFGLADLASAAGYADQAHLTREKTDTARSCEARGNHLQERYPPCPARPISTPPRPSSG
jgi:AraC-like DNA-binding protein